MIFLFTLRIWPLHAKARDNNALTEKKRINSPNSTLFKRYTRFWMPTQEHESFTSGTLPKNNHLQSPNPTVTMQANVYRIEVYHK